ncbi:MAG: MFS transporter [Acutalibacter sp.]|jgi:fucose permease
MATLLLAVIYTAFIGLGIPDSLFGTAWPAIYREFSLPISFASFVTVTTSCGTVVSSLLSSQVIRRFGTARVSAFSTALTAVALLGFSFSGSFWLLILCAIPLGLGAGAIDTALNNYVALHYSATHMSFLHCFYGVGVSLSPYVLSLVISGPSGWRGGYRTAFAMQLVIALLLFLTLPLWKKVQGVRTDTDGGEEKTKALPVRQVLRIPGVKGMCLLFVASVGIEVTTGSWGATFLVEAKGMTEDRAAWYVMFYYIGMAVGRFLSGVLASKLHSWKIIRLGMVVLGAALVVLLLPMPPMGSAVGLFLVGLGNGPMFPNYNYLAPESFGPEVSQSVIGTQMAFSYIGAMLIPTAFGVLGQLTTVALFPAYLTAFFLVMAVFTVKVRKSIALSRKQRESQQPT